MKVIDPDAAPVTAPTQALGDLAGELCGILTVVVIVFIVINSIWGNHSRLHHARTVVNMERMGNALFKLAFKIALAAVVLIAATEYVGITRFFAD